MDTNNNDLKTKKINKIKKTKVLYQNFFGTWYAFTEHNEELFVGKVNKIEEPKPINCQKSNNCK